MSQIAARQTVKVSKSHAHTDACKCTYVLRIIPCYVFWVSLPIAWQSSQNMRVIVLMCTYIYIYICLLIPSTPFDMRVIVKIASRIDSVAGACDCRL